MQNEPEIYEKIYKIMLPGDYIAMRMTDEICTTPSGLSEGIFWDFKEGGLSKTILDFYRITSGLIPKVLPTFSEQGELTSGAAGELGLPAGIKISYRSGDQPNNALSLKVMDPGEIASTAGTSGVVYGVTDKINYDEKSRVNTFVHVNHKKEAPRYGILLCLNGTGILNSWIKHNFMTIKNIGLTYREMDSITGEVPAGSEGLIILPYGNGAERTLENKNIGAAMQGLQFNIHNKAHFLRAAQEGIVFALNYGIEIMEDMGLEVRTVRAGHANMFLSPVFSEAFATITGANVELYNTDGSQGAARGAGIGSGIYRNYQDAFTGLKTIKTIEPVKKNIPVYRETYNKWKEFLESRL
jgi:xylulokinase